MSSNVLDGSRVLARSLGPGRGTARVPTDNVHVAAFMLGHVTSCEMLALSQVISILKNFFL